MTQDVVLQPVGALEGVHEALAAQLAIRAVHGVDEVELAPWRGSLGGQEVDGPQPLVQGHMEVDLAEPHADGLGGTWDDKAPVSFGVNFLGLYFQ